MKGNPRVIEYLNKALTHELTAVNQYWLHYRLLDDWGFTRLAKKEREESIEEMQHADKLVVRIIFLEGFPNLQHIDPLMIGQNIKEVLEAYSEGGPSHATTVAESLCQSIDCQKPKAQCFLVDDGNARLITLGRYHPRASQQTIKSAKMACRTTSRLHFLNFA